MPTQPTNPPALADSGVGRTWTVIGLYTDAYDEHGPVLQPLVYIEGQVQVRSEDSADYPTWATSVETDDEAQVYDLAAAQMRSQSCEDHPRDHEAVTAQHT